MEAGPQAAVRKYGGGETRVGQERDAELVLRRKVFYVIVLIDTDGIAVNIEAELAITSVLKDSLWSCAGRRGSQSPKNREQNLAEKLSQGLPAQAVPVVRQGGAAQDQGLR
ncbi:hypothetical protein ABGV49_02995 [Chromobacterium vaccinii]|uniref:Uncharacterized protein n=1 Tax=Chromobacterium vaccinii TaxID=1108595 RepID=A0ABV0FAF5_9NEIS